MGFINMKEITTFGPTQSLQVVFALSYKVLDFRSAEKTSHLHWCQGPMLNDYQKLQSMGQHCTEAVASQIISFSNSFVLRISFTFFSDPDTIIAPRLPNDSVSERGPSPKAFSCRKASNTPDIDFDYGSAIGKSPEECTAYIQ